MLFRLWLCLLLALLGPLVPVQAQRGGAAAPSPSPALPDAVHGPFVVDAWTTEDGLPQNSVSALVQSRSGYLWIGTNGGLVRFDGVRFTVINRTTTPALPSDRVLALLEDRRSALWVGTQGGGVTRLGADGRVATFAQAEGLPSDVVLSLLETRAGALYAGTEGGLARFDGRRFVPVAAVPALHVNTLFEATDGALWVGTSEQLLRLGAGGAVASVVLPSVENRKPIVGIAQDRAGTVWVATDGAGLLRLDASEAAGGRLTGGAFRRVDAVQGAWAFARSLRADADGVLWAATRGGVLHVEDGQTRAIGVGDGLTTALTRTVYPDAEGDVWVGTDNGGLARLSAAPFRLFGAEQGLTTDVVFSITEDRAGSLWVGTNCGGLAHLGSGGRGAVRTYAEADGLVNTCITSVLEDRAGRLWAGSHGGGLFVREGDRFRPFERDAAGTVLPGRSVLALYEDRAGALWIGTYDGGLSRLKDGRLTTFTTADGLPGTWVRGMLEGRDGTLYVATNAGLGRLRGGRFTALTTRDGLSSDDIRALYEDARGALWVGTYGAGLNRIQGGRIAHVTTADGLPENVVSALVEDASGFFWTTGNRGITRVARTDLDARLDGARGPLRARLFGREAGLRHAETNGGFQPAAWRAADGRLWFPTFSGAAVVDPARLGLNRPPPPVRVEQVDAAGQRWTDVSRLLLPVGARQFTVTYTSLRLADARQTRFRYRLDGIDSAWVEAGTRRTAYFTNVPPGRYTFRVAAASASGVWNEVPATLAIEVPPRVPEMPWFRGLALLVFLGAVGGGVRMRLRRLSARSVHLEAAVDARTHDLAQATARADEARRHAEDERRSADAQRQIADDQRSLADEARQSADAARATVEAQAEALQRLDTAKNRFFADLSHELRTPLSLIIGPVESASEHLRETGHAPVADDLATALRSARRLVRLIDQLLDLARLESQALPFAPRPGDLSAATREIVRAFAPLAEQRGLSLAFHAPSGAVGLRFDPDAIEKVVFNLLANAIKFTPPGGRIAVRVAPHEDGGGVVTVRDTGAGMAPELLPHLFDRFFRGTSAVEGVGIGLALARELVGLHGGRIEVASEVGFGSTFTVTIPPGAGTDGDTETGDAVSVDAAATDVPTGDRGANALPVAVEGEEVFTRAATMGQGIAGAPGMSAEAAHEPDASVSEALDSGEPSSGDGAGTEVDTGAAGRALVLVVEDNDEVRAFTCRHLAVHYRIVEAADGLAALDSAFAHRPDLVVTDLTMPGLDGIELCARLKSDPRTALTPVLMLTARAAPESRVGGLEAGADDYLVKPFGVRELLARVENLLRSRVQLQEAYGRTVTFEASGVSLTSADETFLDRVRSAIEAGMGEASFDVQALALAAGVSYSALHRRVKALTGQPPVQLVRAMRLQRAAMLLESRAGTVAEVAYASGFNNLSYFARSFREHFGTSPSEYAARPASSADAT